jgi:hypothetical protein
LLSFRDSSHLEAGVGDYVFRETFHTMMLSATMARCYAKPRGFPDDHETIAAIYVNQPEGDDRLGPLIDRWFLNRPIAWTRRASRDLMQATLRRMAEHGAAGEPVRIASLASGAADELLNLCDATRATSVAASFIDLDSQALLATARRAERNGLTERVTLIQGNALPTAGESITLLPQHVVYALGLCEYLNDEQVISLLDRIHGLLIAGGSAVVTNLAAENPDRGLMEHVLDWKANHRTPDELRSLFARSLFAEATVEIATDESNVTLFAQCAKAS